MSRILLILVAVAAFAPALEAQHDPDAPAGRYFVGSSAFVVANLVLAGRPDAPHFYQINAGYWLTRRDAVSVEAITWRYHAPVGIPFGPSFGSHEERYPGYVKEIGLGVAYQRLLKGNFYSAVHVLPLVKQYFDEEDQRIQNGFRLFLTRASRVPPGTLRRSFRPRAVDCRDLLADRHQHAGHVRGEGASLAELLPLRAGTALRGEVLNSMRAYYRTRGIGFLIDHMPPALHLMLV